MAIALLLFKFESPQRRRGKTSGRGEILLPEPLLRLRICSDLVRTISCCYLRNNRAVFLPHLWLDIKSLMG